MHFGALVCFVTLVDKARSIAMTSDGDAGMQTVCRVDQTEICP